mgnify:CR=1 FL=1
MHHLVRRAGMWAPLHVHKLLHTAPGMQVQAKNNIIFILPLTSLIGLKGTSKAKGIIKRKTKMRHIDGDFDFIFFA